MVAPTHFRIQIPFQDSPRILNWVAWLCRFISGFRFQFRIREVGNYPNKSLSSSMENWWPSGLRCWFKAQVVKSGRVRIPPGRFQKARKCFYAVFPNVTWFCSAFQIFHSWWVGGFDYLFHNIHWLQKYSNVKTSVNFILHFLCKK